MLQPPGMNSTMRGRSMGPCMVAGVNLTPLLRTCPILPCYCLRPSFKCGCSSSLLIPWGVPLSPWGVLSRSFQFLLIPWGISLSPWGVLLHPAAPRGVRREWGGPTISHSRDPQGVNNNTVYLPKTVLARIEWSRNMQSRVADMNCKGFRDG